MTLNIVLLGARSHPKTRLIVAEFQRRGIPINALLEQRRINYPPALVLQFLRAAAPEGGKSSGPGKFLRRDNLMLALYNPRFALGLLRCLLLGSGDADKYTHQYVIAGDPPVVDFNRLRVLQVDHFNSSGAVNTLRGLAPDVVVCGPAAQILGKEILAVPRVGTLNYHPGVLPEYRGMHPIEYAVLNGDAPGVSAYFVDPGVDTGDILISKELEVTADMSLSELEAQANEISAELLADAAEMIENGNYQRHPQQLSKGKQYFSLHPRLRALAQATLPLRPKP